MLVATSCTVTATPGTTAPEESVTVPRSVDKVSCPGKAAAKSANPIKTPDANLMRQAPHWLDARRYRASLSRRQAAFCQQAVSPASLRGLARLALHPAVGRDGVLPEK